MQKRQLWINDLRFADWSRDGTHGTEEKIRTRTAPEGTYSQQFKQVREKGEFELIAAIIDQARNDIAYSKRAITRRSRNGHASASVVNARKARAWFDEEPSPTAGEWSFPWCCEVLGVDPVKLRLEMEKER